MTSHLQSEMVGRILNWDLTLFFIGSLLRNGVILAEASQGQLAPLPAALGDAAHEAYLKGCWT